MLLIDFVRNYQEIIFQKKLVEILQNAINANAINQFLSRDRNILRKKQKKKRRAEEKLFPASENRITYGGN